MLVKLWGFAIKVAIFITVVLVMLVSLVHAYDPLRLKQSQTVEWNYLFIDDVILERLKELRDNPPVYKWQKYNDYMDSTG